MTGAANRDFWTCGSFADFVAGTALGEPCSESRSAEFVARAAVCEPRSADFVVAGTELGEPEVQISWQVQHLVNLEVQISRQAQHLVNLSTVTL